MTENEVKQGINAITSQSPIQQQIQAIHNMQFPKEEDGQSTLVTGDIEGKVADQIVSSPDRGVEFTPDTTEVYTGGVASPKGAYNTRRQTAEDMGNPLYFEPNYQAVAPYTFDTPAGPVQATTLDLKKLNWQIASTNGLFDDRKYIGYIPVPDVGRLSWWSHVVGGTKGTIATLPLTMAKGLTNTVGTGTKVGTWLMSPAINTAVDLANANPQSIVSDVVKGMAFGTDPDHPTGIIMDTMNNMMDIVDNAVSPEEKSLMRSFNADPDDTSFRARSAQGVGSGVTSFLTAWLSGHPELAFTFMNFANTNQMRHQALDAGVSPMWAELYAAGGSSVNTALDMAQVEVLFGGAAISASTALDYLKNLNRAGLYKFGGRLLRAGEKAAVEGGIEMVQESVEGVFDPDFIEDPVDRLAIAGLAGVALGAIGLPIEVLRAPAAEKAKVAKALGVLGQYNNVRDLAVNLVDGWAKEGRIDPSQKEQLIDMIMTEAPQQVIRDLRAGVKGQLDKIPVQDRMEFAKTLRTLEEANKNNLFTPEKIEALDKEVDTALVGVRAGMPDSEVTMIKGLVRGAYVVANIAHASDPNFQFSVPKFIVATNKDGYSYYDPKTNTIGIHGTRSDTVNTNASAQYASQVTSGFRRATEISDRMASILHEMSHWLDHMVGQKGFGDFLEHYYNDIAKVFGEEKAQEMYDASNGGVNRVSTKKQKGKSTEQHAQAVARLGKRAAESFGLGRSQANKFLSYANLVLNQMKGLEGEGGEKMVQWIDAYQEAVQKITRDNMDVLSDLIEVYGTDNLKEALRKFSNEGKYQYEDFAQYVANKYALRDLYNVLDSFADAAGVQKIKDLFDGDQVAMDNFVTMGDKMFRNGYNTAVEEVRQRRQDAKNKAENKAKPVEAKADKDAVVTGDGVVMSKTNDKIDASDMPTFFDDKSVEHEEVDTWHGTKSIFDRFKTLIGTGEKGSAHGWGIYLTTLKDRAKHYWHDIALRDNIIPINIDYTYYNSDTSTYYKGSASIKNDSALHEAFQEWYHTWASQHDDDTDILWYTREQLLDEDGLLPDQYNNASEKQIRKANLLTRYIKARAQEEYGFDGDVLDVTFNISGDFGQVLKTITPDTDTMLQEGKMLIDQNDYVQSKIQEINEELNLGIKDSGIRGVAIYNKIADVLGSEEAASRLLSQHGINGIEYVGFVDGRSFVVFDPETIKIVDIYRDRENIEELEIGTQGQMQDWAKAALGAKESVKQSFESAKKTKQIPADKQIDGRNLTDDINMASNGLSKRVAQPMNKFVKWASSSKWGWGLDRILITVLGRDVAEKFDVAGKYSAKQAARTRYWDEFQKRLEPLFGKKDKTEFMFKYKTMVTDLGFVRMNNVEMINPANTALSFKRNITGWEAMYVYLMDRQGYGARVQKSTTTNIKDIIALLSPKEKSFADAMSDQLMDMYKRTFKEGSKYENYFPIQSAEHELYNELSIDSLTARQKTDDAIAIIDAGRVFSQYVSRWASHESGYFETLKRLRDVLGYRGVSANEAGPGYIFNADEEKSRIKASAQVAATVRQVLGNDGYDNLMNNINSEIQDKQELLFDKSRQNVLTQLGNDIMKSILANKVISFPKNAVNMMMMFGGAKDQSLYWNSFAEGWAKPKETYDYMMAHSNEIKQRWGTAGGINEYLDQRTLGGNTAPAMKAVSKAFANMKWDGDKTNNMAKFSAVMDMLGDAGLKLFMQSGDMIANVYGGYGLIKDYIAQGMTEEEAFKKLDRYIIEHQSSSNLAMKPLIQKEHMGDFLGQVFAFTSEGVAKCASIMGTFDEVNMGTATRSEAITNAASIAISMALYSILAAGAWDLLSDDEKVQEDTQKALVNTVIDQVFGGMVAGNALISPMISYMIGDTRLSGMSTPFYNYAIDFGTALKKGNYFEAWLKAQSALGLPIGADNAWNTMLGISLLTDPNPQVREAGKLMMMGYTKNRAAKRAGIDKETIENSDEE
jgi:hypothetical protein